VDQVDHQGREVSQEEPVVQGLVDLKVNKAPEVRLVKLEQQERLEQRAQKDPLEVLDLQASQVIEEILVPQEVQAQ